MRKINARRKLVLLLALCGVALFAVAAFALTIENLAFGRIAFLERFNGPADVYIDRLTLEPGETVPWHYHPGDAYVVVKTGTLTFTDGCGNVTRYSAGDAFFEPVGGVHQITNEGTVQSEFFGTIVAPAGAPEVTFVGGPLCGPPASAEQCQDGGWMSFNNPAFKNQGECVSVAEHNKPKCK